MSSPDSSDPRMRVRPSVVVFPAWGFGTASEVRVTIPAGYEIRVDGDAMTEEGGSLVSGPIPDPSRWLALVTAVQPSEFTNFDATVPLDGGTADLRVRAFADDEPWGERTLGLVTDALPLIEATVGLPYPRIGQLAMTESVTADVSGFGEQPTGGTELLIAFDQPPFTALHQVSHIWLSPELIESRWLREGLATSVAAEVAAQLDIEVPFDPAEQVVELADAAFPLDTWSTDAGPDGEAYGYAASWAFIDALEEEVGADAVRDGAGAGRRVASGRTRLPTSSRAPLPDGVAARRCRSPRGPSWTTSRRSAARTSPSGSRRRSVYGGGRRAAACARGGTGGVRRSRARSRELGRTRPGARRDGRMAVPGCHCPDRGGHRVARGA